MSDSDFYLKTARYGKDLVRFMRVYRDGKVQRCAELTVRLLLEGDIETSYTKADNSVVVATGNDDIHDFWEWWNSKHDENRYCEEHNQHFWQAQP